MTIPCPPDPGDPKRIALCVAAVGLGVLLLFIVLVVLMVAGGAEPAKAPLRVFVATPERIVDGDTVVYVQGSCRLAGVDSPERRPAPGQPLAEDAFRALRDELLRGPNTVLVYQEKDKYGRMICAILDASGYLVNLWLVESGFAETYFLDRSPFAPGFAAAQQRAKAEKRGIWALPKYESPEHFRKRMREK